MAALPAMAIDPGLSHVLRSLRGQKAYRRPEHNEESQKTMTDIVIASAARTPVGSFNGAFASLAAHDLGVIAIKEALARAWGVRGVVRKRRELFFFHNVRIHLDQVEGLGTFLEFEAVVGAPGSDGLPVDTSAAHRQVEMLFAEFQLTAADTEHRSYSDLLDSSLPTADGAP